MIAEVQTAFAPVVIAFGIVALFVGVPLLVSKLIGEDGVPAPRTGLPLWLADLDLGDDGADTKRGPATEAAQRQALAIANSPTVARAVVDELAQRRAVQS